MVMKQTTAHLEALHLICRPRRARGEPRRRRRCRRWQRRREWRRGRRSKRRRRSAERAEAVATVRAVSANRASIVLGARAAVVAHSVVEPPAHFARVIAHVWRRERRRRGRRRCKRRRRRRRRRGRSRRCRRGWWRRARRVDGDTVVSLRVNAVIRHRIEGVGSRRDERGGVAIARRRRERHHRASARRTAVPFGRVASLARDAREGVLRRRRRRRRRRYGRHDGG